MGDFVRMVHQELSVVHALEYLNVRFRAESKQMLGLGLGHEGLFRPVPEVNVGPGDGL